jgi:hypothetical protein
MLMPPKAKTPVEHSNAIRGIGADFGPEHADTLRPDVHPDLRADYVLANGSMSSNQSGEGDIRCALIEANLVDCMVARAPFHSSSQFSARPSFN